MELLIHHALPLFYFPVGALDHLGDEGSGLGVELPHLIAEGILVVLLFGLLFGLVEEGESLGVGEQASEFPLEMAGLLGVLVDVELNGQAVEVVQLLHGLDLEGLRKF